MPNPSEFKFKINELKNVSESQPELLQLPYTINPELPLLIQTEHELYLEHEFLFIYKYLSAVNQFIVPQLDEDDIDEIRDKYVNWFFNNDQYVIIFSLSIVGTFLLFSSLKGCHLYGKQKRELRKMRRKYQPKRYSKTLKRYMEDSEKPAPK